MTSTPDIQRGNHAVEQAVQLPFSQACENNKMPIWQQLAPLFKSRKQILEIGSGSGQHATFFAPQLPHCQWQCTERPQFLNGLQSRLEQENVTNIPDAVPLDVLTPPLCPPCQCDAIFTANTLHIMSPAAVKACFALAGKWLPLGGLMVIYGPVNRQGRFTSASNKAFDQRIRARDSQSGIRDIAWLTALAGEVGLTLQQDLTMPANNCLLVMEKTSA